MTSLFSTALMGLFLLSNVSTSTLSAPTWTTESPKVPTYQTYTVAMTGYNAVPAQTDESPDLTASGTIPVPGVTAARSRDLADELPFGTVIEIIPTDATSSVSCGLGLVGNDVGLRVITDTMHRRKTNQIDILFDPDNVVRVGDKNINPAVVFGICRDVEIRVVGTVNMSKLPKTQIALRAALNKASLVLGK